LNKKITEKVVECLNGGQEAVMLPSAVTCAAYQKGIDLLRHQIPTMPLNEDPARACMESGDWRTLPGNIIKTIAKANRMNAPIDPYGIRIIGAIFCEQLDLIGLDLPYSVVIDKSIFVKGIQARNFRTGGDLSFEQSLILDELRIARSHVRGTIFANKSFVKKIQILDTEIGASLLVREALLLDPVIFDTVSISGELSLRESVFSHFLLQFSKVAGVLDLTNSQARCAYSMKKSDIGDLVAVGAGFGSVNPPSAGDSDKRPLLFWRPSSKLAPLIQAVGPILAAEDKTHCNYSTIAPDPGTFAIFDTRVKSSLCLRSFNWLTSTTVASPTSTVRFNNINVGAATFVDLAATAAAPNHYFEIIDFQTESLFFNFVMAHAPDGSYRLSVSGLKFEHVYAAQITCGYDPDFASPDGAPPAHSMRLPRVEEVMSWLDSNHLITTQPFAAFVDVFQKHGEIKDARELRIGKASAELCLRAQRIFGAWIWTWICGYAEDMAKRDADQPFSLNFIELGNDFAAVALGALLWLVADHGYHPQKVGWFVLGALLLFRLYFRFILKIVRLKPKEKEVLLPTGFMFLFDRLLPAYQIRSDHYNIASFYKFGPKDTPNLKTIKYLWWPNASVVETSQGERQHVERCLEVLRIIGFVLAIFLVAAVNAFVIAH